MVVNVLYGYHLKCFCKVDAVKKTILSCLLFCVTSNGFSSESIHWGYDADVSPNKWGDLSEGFKLCKTGKNQTPINISETYHSSTEHKVDIQYVIAPSSIVFNGHTVQINNNSVNNYIIIDNRKFILKQFHFHTPSENQIKGESYPLELHFVNTTSNGEIVVLAVMFKFGKENSEWEKFWKDLSSTENKTNMLSKKINLEKLLPENREYYRFSGSLTTPPCSEGVIWIVLKKQLTISNKQLDDLKKILGNKYNNRPIQQTNGRVVIED